MRARVKRSPRAALCAGVGLLIAIAAHGAHAQSGSAATVEALNALEREATALRGSVLRARTQLTDVQMEAVASALLPSGPTHPELLRRARELPQLVRALADARRRLAALDARIDAALAHAYARLDPSAVRVGRVSSQTTRLALLHWTILLRRAAAGPVGTRVPDLQRSSTCQGDAVTNRLAWAYFDRVSRPGQGARAPSAALVQALAALQRQLSCLDGRRLLLFDAYLVKAFDALEKRLHAQHLEAIVRSVVDLSAEVMLLSFDAAKFHGQRSASYGWWQKNAGLVRDGLQAGRSALAWHGFWLFDRHAGRLVGLRSRCSERGASDCVDGPRFVASISDPADLGNGDCAFLEMIRRGDGPRGYQCTGSVCNVGREPGGPALSSPSGNRRPTGRSERSTCPAGAFSPFGVPCAQVAALCSSPNRDAASDRAAICGQPGNALRDPQLRCVTSRLNDAPIHQLVRCFAEAAGTCDPPIDRLSKQLTAAAERVPLASGCHFVADDAGGQTDRDFEQKKREALGRIDDPAYKEQVRQAVETKVRERDPSGFDQTSFNQNFEQAYAAMRYAVDNAVLGPEAPGGPNSIATTVGGDLIVFSEDKFIYYTQVDPSRTNPTFVRDSFLHEGIHALGNDLDPEGLLLDGEDEHDIARHLGLPDCPPDAPTCGGGCPYGTAQLGERKPCVLEADREPSDSGYVDPSPLDAPAAPAWVRCFASLADPQARGQRTCLGVDCAIGMHCDPTARGRCVADTPSAAPSDVPPGCRNFILCPPGEPLSFDGHFCRCGQRTMEPAPTPEPGGPRPGGPDIPRPPRPH